MTQTVVATISQVGDGSGLACEIEALLTFIQHMFGMRNVMRQRKQWEEDRQAKITAAIALAMKQWDDDHYPRLLEATWGWHPFYHTFVANLLCSSFRPSYPLVHTVVEGLATHTLLMTQTHVQRVYPVPWSVLMLRCFLKYFSVVPTPISHPVSGGSIANVTTWLAMAEDDSGEGWRAWQLATTYLREDGFLVFAGAREVDSRQQWISDVDAAWTELKSPSPAWWAELRAWCQSTQFWAVQDMAFYDKPSWLNAWVIRDRPATWSPPLTSYELWLQYREDLDIGYVLAKPGMLQHL